VSLTEALDLTTPTGRAMAGLLSVFAEFEHATIVDRSRAADYGCILSEGAAGAIDGKAPFRSSAIDELAFHRLNPLTPPLDGDDLRPHELSRNPLALWLQHFLTHGVSSLNEL